MPDDVVKRRWNTALADINLGRFFAEHCGHGVDLCFPEKGTTSGQYFVEDRSQAENVAAMIHGFAPELFRRHVGDSTDHSARLGYGCHGINGLGGLGRRLRSE